MFSVLLQDKLRDHVRRVHPPETSASDDPKTRRRAAKSAGGAESKFVPKISPSDYQQFIFKCYDCQLGFKRRGMLVNHLAKRHPDVNVSSVPELNLPIVRSQRDFYCQYCEKVYKSSSKRKSHIMKAHPGATMPAGARRGVLGEAGPLPNATFSATVGSVLSAAHACTCCHKQYASKAKLLQHQRKKHGSTWDPVTKQRVRGGPVAVAPRESDVAPAGGSASKLLTAAMITRCLSEGGQVQIIQAADQTAVPLSADIADSDLLTQAMSELTQSFGTEFRLVTANMAAGGSSEFQTVVPCLVSVAADPPSAAPSLDSTAANNPNLIFNPSSAALAVQKAEQHATQILHTFPKTVSSALYPLQCVNANAVTKNVI